MPMMHVGLDNFDLVKYLVSQVMLSEEDRFEALKEYIRKRKKRTGVCGKRGSVLQIIKRDADKGSICVWVLKWSVTGEDRLPRSWGHRGASTAAPIMLNLLEKVFGDRVSSPQWQATLKAIVPLLLDAS
ncbi:malate:quinone oxidoreductase [Escherichia coli]